MNDISYMNEGVFTEKELEEIRNNKSSTFTRTSGKFLSNYINIMKY